MNLNSTKTDQIFIKIYPTIINILAVIFIIFHSISYFLANKFKLYFAILLSSISNFNFSFSFYRGLLEFDIIYFLIFIKIKKAIFLISFSTNFIIRLFIFSILHFAKLMTDNFILPYLTFNLLARESPRKFHYFKL